MKAKTGKFRVALVVMPWTGVDFPPLGVATLKAYLRERGIEADCHYLNLRFASKLGEIANPFPLLRRWTLWSEWLFGYHLFGPGGTGEAGETLEDMLRRPDFAGFLRSFGLAPAQAGRLLEESIPSFLDECLEEIPWAGYDLIGFSSIFCSHAACLKLSRQIKARHPGIPIVFGGSNVEGEMGAATMEGCDWIDYLVDGEGEEALLSLIRNIQGGKPFEPTPGVRLRRDGRAQPAPPGGRKPVDLDGLPTPDHGDFFQELGRSRLDRWIRPAVTFEASRGCWWGQKSHCTFCGLNGGSMAFRAKKPELVLRDVLALHERHGALDVRAADNILGVEHLRELIPLLAEARRERGLEWDIYFEIKSNAGKKDMERLRDAGVLRLQPGIESLSTPVLRLMRKGVSAIQNVQFLKAAAECGIRAEWNVLGGFPGEEPAEYAKMADLALSLTHLIPPDYCGPIRVDRFSPYHSDFERLGTGRPRPMPAYELLYPPRRFDAGRIAYFFEMSRPPGAPDPEEYMAPLKRAVEAWKQVWPRNFFVFKQGAGFVELRDSRPLGLGGAEYREHRLTGLEAFVFSHGRVLRGLAETLEAARAAGFSLGPGALRDILEEMERRRWVMREESSYLSLATSGGLSPAQELALQRMEHLHRSYLPPPRLRPAPLER